MNNKTIPGPDLESIINGITQSPQKKDDIPGDIDSKDECRDSLSSDYKGRLWEEFLDILKENQEDLNTVRIKLYAIDDDIVETLHQCNFGKPNVHVINSILRTFLIDNIPRLKEMYRPRSISLLDKYN